MTNSLRAWYDRHVLPCVLDCACGLPVIAAQRQKVVPRAAGRVLEIGIGTGLNMPFYDHRNVRTLVGVDSSERMQRLALRRSERAGLPVELHALSAERLPFDAGSFDDVVCTYTLCSVTDPLAALREVRRVLRPAGRLLFIEHGLSPDRAVARWQRRAEPYWGCVAGGCRLTNDVDGLLREAGFAARVDQGYIAWPKSLSYNFWGMAMQA